MMLIRVQRAYRGFLHASGLACMISPLTTTTSPSLLEACITAVATYLPDQVNVSAEAVPAEHLQDAIWQAFCRRLQELRRTHSALDIRDEWCWLSRVLQQFVQLRPPHALVINWSWIRSQALPALAPLGPYLCHLSLAGTAVDQLLPLTALTSLSCISLAHCDRLLPPTLSVLACLTQLEAVDLSHTPHLGDAAAPHLAALPRLRILQLSHSHVSDNTLMWLTYDDRTADWQAATAAATGPRGPFHHVMNSTDTHRLGTNRRAPLQRLHLAHTRVSAAGCQHLLALRQLQFLDVRGTGIPGGALRALQHRFLLTVLQGAVLSRTPAPVLPTDLCVCCCNPTQVPAALGSDASAEGPGSTQSGHGQLPESGQSQAVAVWFAVAGVPACDRERVFVACQGGLETCIPQLLVLTQAMHG